MGNWLTELILTNRLKPLEDEKNRPAPWEGRTRAQLIYGRAYNDEEPNWSLETRPARWDPQNDGTHTLGLVEPNADAPDVSAAPGGVQAAPAAPQDSNGDAPKPATEVPAVDSAISAPLPGEGVDLSHHPGEFYETAREMRSAGQQEFPGERLSEIRHYAVSYLLAKEFGEWPVRLAGAVNELQGLALHDIPDLPGRLNGERPWAFQLKDLLDNEAGIAKAVEERERRQRHGKRE